uniref:Uncharacterized protein n=1 Tax=Panagrolaimus sp. PS1159 TaxID=55785 RepID=A0AC35FQA4_9BILA
MDGKRHHRKSHKSGGLEGSDNGLPTTVVFDPTTTDSARLKIITKLEALDNAKSDSRITVGHEVETKKNK